MNEKELIESGIIEVTENGEVFVKKTGKALTPKNNGNGYLRIYIPKIKKRFLLHRLVATAYIPNPDNKPQVNHIDGNKLNNKADNLEWVTAQENNLHARKLGLIKQNKPLLVTNIETGEEIVFESLSECARFLNCNKFYVHRALNGIDDRTQYKGFKFKYI